MALTAAIFGLVAAGGCASNKALPMKIQSDPLGAYVVYQEKTSSSSDNADWIYLGKTPLNIQRPIDNKIDKDDSLRLRVMKDGYNDQIRDWSGDDIETEMDELGHLFWNPRLVPGVQ